MPTNQEDTHQKLADYLTVGEAATFLGASTSTLRNWDRTGKLTASRHPINGYRLYRREDLDQLLDQLRGLETRHEEQA